MKLWHILILIGIGIVSLFLIFSKKAAAAVSSNKTNDISVGNQQYVSPNGIVTDIQDMIHPAYQLTEIDKALLAAGVPLSQIQTGVFNTPGAYLR